ncbi:hypothetical protein OQX61_19165, partial [Pedobacter sp. PLR]|nr:hypothetical protein [Pedobacter sp. PLR]
MILETLRHLSFSVINKLCCLAVLCLLVGFSTVYAEGSKDLYPNGAEGNRAFLNCNSNNLPTESWPFKTAGTHYVYAKAGETIAVASSAYGIGKGDIKVTSPLGIQIPITSVSPVGNIPDRKRELAGPKKGKNDVANVYTPIKIVVTAETEGIWKVEFLPPSGLDGDNKTSVEDITAIGNWEQPYIDRNKNPVGNIDHVAAWDVSVLNISGDDWLTGRVYANVLNLHLNGSFTSAKAYYATHYVLTKDGRAYRVKTNGSNGVGFTFFSNSNGFAVNSVPTYKSLDKSTLADILAFTHNPTLPDNGTNTTHKIFYNKPNPDLPVTARIANYPGGLTWLKNEEKLPEISDLKVIGAEGSPGLAGKNGANIQFESSTIGTYRITIPVTIAGVSANRVIIGVAQAGTNHVFWDGKDANGNYLLPTNLVSTLKTKLQSAEVHFPYIDMEINPKGLIIELTDNTTNYGIDVNEKDESKYSSRIYWDDSNVTGAGAEGYESSDPFENAVNGLLSTTNGHKWGAYKSGSAVSPENSGSGSYSFGNKKSMDTWAYIQGSEKDNPIDLTIKVADLQIVSITPNLSSFLSNQQVTYTVKVKNDGPSDVTGAAFTFVNPPGFEIDPLTNPVFSVNGVGMVRNPLVSAERFTAMLDMNNKCEVEFTITGKLITSPSVPVITAEASILRPADVTDPDATNPNATPDGKGPTDPHLECKNGNTIENCNNIKYHHIQVYEVCSGSNISPISYQGNAGIVSVLGNVPALSFGRNDASQLMNVTGKPTATGSFTLGTTGNDKDKTTYLIHVVALPVVTLPTALTVCNLGSISITATADGQNNTYKWQYKDSNNDWKFFDEGADVHGVTTSVLTLSNVPLTSDKQEIKVLVHSSFGCDAETTGILKVAENPTTVTISSTELEFCQGGAATLSSSYEEGNQWYKDGVIIQDATDPTLMVFKSGVYTVVVTNEFGCSTQGDNSIEINVKTPPKISKIIVEGNAISCSGEEVRLSVTTNDLNLTYQWVGNTGDLPGETNSFLLVTKSGKYLVKAKSPNGCQVMSFAVDVTIKPRALAGNITAGNQTICAGEKVLLTAESTLKDPVFTWYSDALLEHKIQEGSTLEVRPSATTDYFVTVRNSDICENAAADAKEVTVIVNPIPDAPVIEVVELEFCEGSSTLLTSSSATGNQWYKDGLAIPDADKETYIATESGKYTLVVTLNNCA